MTHQQYLWVLSVGVQNPCGHGDTSAYTCLCVGVWRPVCENILLSHSAHLIYSISSGNSCRDIVTLSKLYWLAGPFRGAQAANEMWQLNELPALNLNRFSRTIGMNGVWWTWGHVGLATQMQTYMTRYLHIAKVSVIIVVNGKQGYARRYNHHRSTHLHCSNDT